MSTPMPQSPRQVLRTILLTITFPLALTRSVDAGTVSTWLFDERDQQIIRDVQGTNDGYLGTSPLEDSSDPLRTSETPFDYSANRALSFSGSTFGTDVVAVTNRPSLEVASITLEGWFKPAVEPAEYTRLFTKGDAIGGTTGSFRLYTKNGTSPINRVIWALNLNGTLKELGTPADLDIFTFTNGNGNWVHLAATYSAISGATQIFVNGKLVTSATFANTSLVWTPIDLKIGNRSESDRGFKGLIDEVRLSDVALSADQLGYHGPFSPPPMVTVLVVR